MMDAMERSELAYIGLGANVGAARETMVGAVAALSALPGASVEAVSRLYRTRPVGPVAQGDFLNAVAALRVQAGADAAQGAMALLIALKGIEHGLGRQERERWGARELDLDLLLFGGHRLRLERDAAARSGDRGRPAVQWLVVPHPAAAERLFVLAPLADLAPELEPPGWGVSVGQAQSHALAAEGRDAVRAIGVWDSGTATWSERAEP